MERKNPKRTMRVDDLLTLMINRRKQSDKLKQERRKRIEEEYKKRVEQQGK